MDLSYDNTKKNRNRNRNRNRKEEKGYDRGKRT